MNPPEGGCRKQTIISAQDYFSENGHFVFPLKIVIFPLENRCFGPGPFYDEYHYG